MVDYNAYNAFASETEKVISFLAGCLKKELPAEVKNITEHEILHKYVAEKGLTENSKLRTIFADLKGYTDDRRNRIIQRGFVPFDEFNKDYQNKTFFNFIAEKNYFKVGGGHPHSNIWEFCTSFTHSLMYIDKLEENLESTEAKFSTEDKLTILKNYITVLDKMRSAAKDRQAKKFFSNKLKQVRKIHRKYGK